jgi:glycosyltransferase involved in cell wall biosynthesis
MFEVPDDRITIEGCGFEPDVFNWKAVRRDEVMKRRLGIDIGHVDRMIVSVGKFVDWKGFKELIAAIGMLRGKGIDVAAVIVGEGDPESRRDLEACIAANGLSGHVFLPGKVERETLPDIYRSGDLYVLPSHVEPFGMVLMEALACGAPAVSANTGGPPHFVPEKLIKERLAVLVDPIRLTPGGDARPEDRTPYARRLADGMAAILGMSISDRERRRIAEAMRPLSWERLVGSLSGIYDRLIDRALSRLSP